MLNLNQSFSEIRGDRVSALDNLPSLYKCFKYQGGIIDDTWVQVTIPVFPTVSEREQDQISALDNLPSDACRNGFVAGRWVPPQARSQVESDLEKMEFKSTALVLDPGYDEDIHPKWFDGNNTEMGGVEFI